MLAPSPGFLKTEEPPDASQEAQASPSQGRVCRPAPAARTNQTKPGVWGSAHARGKESPMWQAALRD